MFFSNFACHFLYLERFSNSRALNGSKESGFFLRKKPLSSRAFGVQQLENRYNQPPKRGHYFSSAGGFG
jgi:hypothetical protein